MHSNRLSTLSSLTSLQSLRILNAASNGIAALVNLAPLTALVELNLRRNALTTLTLSNAFGPGAAQTSSLGQEGAAVNNIDTVDGSNARQLGLPASLQRLYVSNNSIAAAQELRAVHALTGLEELSIDGNPLSGNAHPAVRFCPIYLVCLW